MGWKKFFLISFHLLKSQLLQLLPIAKMSSNTQDLVLAYINDYVSRNEELSKLKKALSKFLAGKELPKVSNSWNPLLMKWKIKKRKANQETHHLIVKTLHLR